MVALLVTEKYFSYSTVDTTLCLWDPAEEYEHVNKERSNTGARDTTIRYVFGSISLYF